jgi:anti-anti-sigma regulatory factor
MNITSQITVSMKPELYRSRLNNLMFKPGLTLKLKVLELRGDRALIDFGRFRATADIKIPVTLGEELTVRVLEAGKQLKLGVIDSDQTHPRSPESMPKRLDIVSDENLNKIQNDLKQILNQAVDLKNVSRINSSILNVLESLISYFEPLDLKKIITELISRLRSNFENSGIFFEKRLEKVIAQALDENAAGSGKKPADLPEVKALFNRDLKPNLLMLQHLVEEKDTLQKIFGPKALASLKSTIDTLLTDITFQQGRAINQLESADPFQVFTYTIPLKEGGQTAKLKVFYEKKQKSGSKKGFQISLFLSMDRLGDIRTDFVLLENDLNITFFVTEPSAKTRIQKNCSKLQVLLNGLFDHVQLKVKVSEKKVRDFDRPTLPAAGDRNVDLRI